jgi:hypothetical protein
MWAALLLLPCFGEAVLISGSGTWGSFQGSLSFTCQDSSGEAALVAELTNTSAMGNGGYITGFALNNPGNTITAVVFSDSAFQLLGAPLFSNGINASPLGYFDIGAAVGGDWQGGGDPQAGIGVGESASFHFQLSGGDLCALNVMRFVQEYGEGGDNFFVVRFRGFHDGNSDKVPAGEILVPVKLSSFTATGQSDGIEIQWTSQTEVNALWYHLQRRQGESGAYQEIACLDAYGNSETPRTYRHRDVNVSPGKKYFYSLIDEDALGNTATHGPVLAAFSTGVPSRFQLLPNYPNPFNPSTTISYQLPTPASVELTIYDVLGRKVRSLADGHRQAGHHTTLWNGRDDSGRELKSGVYFCVFETGSQRQTIKMVLSR